MEGYRRQQNYNLHTELNHMVGLGGWNNMGAK